MRGSPRGATGPPFRRVLAGEDVRFAFADGAPSLDITGKLDGDEGREVPLRSVLVHMIEEYARHCGHADLLRERIDGRVGQLVTEAEEGPGRLRGRWSDGQQDPLVGREVGGQLVVRRDDPAVLLADRADVAQVGRDVLADLHRAG